MNLTLTIPESTQPPITVEVGGTTELTSYVAQVAGLPDYPAAFPPAIGSAANQAVAGNDPRLTNSRTPTAHTHPLAELTGVTPAAIGAEPAKGADDNFVTDAEKTVIGNTSGTNTGDETGARIATALNAGTQDATAADTDRLAVTHPAGGWMLLSTLWTWITTKLGALTSITAGGAWSFSSTTRPTSAGTGTPAATSLITATDGDTRYGREYYSVVATPIEAFSTAFVNGPNFVVPAGSYDFEIFVVIKAVGETSGAQYNVACSPTTDVSIFQDIRLANIASLGTGGTVNTSFRNQTNAIGNPDFISTYMDAPHNFASSHCRGSTVLASETTINLRIRQRTTNDAVNAAQILAGSFIRFTKR